MPCVSSQLLHRCFQGCPGESDSTSTNDSSVGHHLGGTSEYKDHFEPNRVLGSRSSTKKSHQADANSGILLKGLQIPPIAKTTRFDPQNSQIRLSARCLMLLIGLPSHWTLSLAPRGNWNFPQSLHIVDNLLPGHFQPSQQYHHR